MEFSWRGPSAAGFSSYDDADIASFQSGLTQKKKGNENQRSIVLDLILLVVENCCMGATIPNLQSSINPTTCTAEKRREWVVNGMMRDMILRS